MTTTMIAENATIAQVDGAVWLTPDEKMNLVHQEAYAQGKKVAQIFSGVFFTGVATWLTVSNGTRLSFVQRAALEKRLTTCCFLCTYVAGFSCFFNYFQLTTVQEVHLPSAGGYTLDLARPIEWICTCPLMQLLLVLMGGSKLPEYRRYLMPSFSATILVLGAVGAFFGDALIGVKIFCFSLSCLVFGVMIYFNRLQIIEYSGGEECLFQGDSEFRKATLLLISTWSPFPIWYAVSPEGLNLLNDVLIIQVGWAFLNIVAKFSFIFYIQRIKDMYCNRLKTKRELMPAKNHMSGVGGRGMRPGAFSPMMMDEGFAGNFAGMLPGMNGAGGYNAAQELEAEELAKKKAQLSAVVVETMSFLGMVQHTDRFLKLLDNANMTSIFEVEGLTKDQCQELQLPHELVSALQRRLRVWKLEMVDDAEAGLDKGEEFYIRRGADAPQGGDGGDMYGMMIPLFDPEEQNQKLDEIRGLLKQKLRAEETILHESRSTGELLDKSAEGIVGRFQAAMEAMEQRINERMAESGAKPIDAIDATAKEAATQQRSEVRAFETRITAKLDELATLAEQQRRHELHALESRICAVVEHQVALLATRVELCYQKVEANGQRVDVVGQKLDVSSAEQTAKFADSMTKLSERFEEAFKAAHVHAETVAKRVDGGLSQLNDHSTVLKEELQTLSSHTRAGFDLCTAKAEAIHVTLVKAAATSEDGWRQRFSELESNMICREDDREVVAKRRFEELARASPVKKLEDLSAQLAKVGDRVDQATEAVGTALTSEIQSAANRSAAKSDNAQSAILRQLAEMDTAAVRRVDETAQQVQSSGAMLSQRIDSVSAEQLRRLEAARAEALRNLEASLMGRLDGLDKASQATSERAMLKTSAALEEFATGVAKRVEESIARSASDCAHLGATTAERRAEKAVEALEASTRTELHSATTNLLERFDDIQAVQVRKATEREERNLRRLEELLEIVAARTTQKTEDVGIDVKKELHGFAKRLNSKIPFM